jgi:phosphate/sulfate permease
MDEKTFKLLSFFIKIITLSLLGISVYLVIMDIITMKELLVYILVTIVGAALGFFLLWAIYKLFFEKRVYAKKRLQTIQLVTSDYIPSEIAVTGDRRGGKDTLATGIVRFCADAFYNEINKNLEHLKRNILYIFDFRKIDKYLQSSHARKHLMNESPAGKRKKFKRIFYDHRGFLKGRYMKQYCGESRKLAIKFIRDKKSGLYFDNHVKKECFFDLLMEYIEGYIRIHLIEQMVISNQPFMEMNKDLDGVDLAAKKISYDYFKIKADKMFPWIRHLIIYDTEATLYWNNADSEQDKANKGTNGALEFFIGKGHFLKRFKYITTIQEEDRAQAWYRGLFEIKIGLLEKFRFVCTSPIRRFFKRFARGFYKVINFLILKRTSTIKLRVFLIKESRENPSKLKRIISFILIWVLIKPIHFSEKRIKQLTQREQILLMEAKLEFNVSIEFRNKGDNYPKRSLRSLTRSGFRGQNAKTKLVIDVLDAWPYYSTEHLGDAGDTLQERSKLKFKEIPEWDKNLHFDLINDGKHLNHKLYNTILDLGKAKPKGRKTKK